ncbi:hypothetical protein [Streptomyces anulatus]|uniref:hypothetical protein n=1 Tax=Streptomyces anulatus TaxID=1892 RepID=UPI00386C9F19|nr:hypothetical protein OG575_05750 [Streptomyces anulatus]
MSTNYYAFGPFPGGDPDGEGLHIGQTAAGWRFLFRAHNSLGITTLPDWEHFLRATDVAIRNEYGRDASVDEMVEMMEETTDREGFPLRPRFRSDDDHRYVTSGGHSFCRREFF